MKKTILSLCLLSLLLVSAPVIADVCTLDAVPAATLLLPYFEVDLDDAQGVTTLFSVNNASAAPVIAHVSMWTDLSVVTLDFDLYLTGYDVVTLNLRDIFVNGRIPATGPANLTGASAATGEGAYSFNSVVPASCANSFPASADGFIDIPASLVTLAQQAHTGQAVSRFGGACGGVNHGDNIARGYITVDVVNQCSVQFPNSPGYFDTIAGFENVLWGDFFLVDPANNFAQGETLVHLEADQAAFGVDDYTFYGRYVSFTGTDAREPLPSTYATRYIQNAVFTGGTELICWRDPKVNVSPFSCGLGAPSPFPLGQEEVVIFDEDENPELIEESPISPVEEFEFAACPWETQRAIVGGNAIPASPDAGWLYMNLNNTVAGAPLNPYAQAYVMPIMSANGLFSVGFDAIQLNDLCNPTNVVLPVN